MPPPTTTAQIGEYRAGSGVLNGYLDMGAEKTPHLVDLTHPVRQRLVDLCRQGPLQPRTALRCARRVA